MSLWQGLAWAWHQESQKERREAGGPGPAPKIPSEAQEERVDIVGGAGQLANWGTWSLRSGEPGEVAGKNMIFVTIKVSPQPRRL